MSSKGKSPSKKEVEQQNVAAALARMLKDGGEQTFMSMELHIVHVAINNDGESGGCCTIEVRHKKDLVAVVNGFIWRAFSFAIP